MIRGHVELVVGRFHIGKGVGASPVCGEVGVVIVLVGVLLRAHEEHVLEEVCEAWWPTRTSMAAAALSVVGSEIRRQDSLLEESSMMR